MMDGSGLSVGWGMNKWVGYGMMSSNKEGAMDGMNEESKFWSMGSM